MSRYSFYEAKEAIVFEVFAGANINYVVEEAIKIADLLDTIIVFTFNECNMIVQPKENYQDVLKRFKCGANSTYQGE